MSPKSEKSDIATAYIKQLQELSAKVAEPPKFNPTEHNDKTRSKIALYFVKGFFVVLIGALALIPPYNIWAHNQGVETLSLKDILLAISGIISGPLGFVIGHYFKSDSSK